MTKTFLQAEWRKLAMANYAVDKNILEPYLPYHTELDEWKGTCYVSLVGFMFLDTKVKGLRIPFHTTFPEVNLRFYVRYHEHGAWKRGVVFIKEIVPKPALTFVANTIYRENYETLPMNHLWETIGATQQVEYRWKKGKWHSISVIAGNQSAIMKEGSEEEFIMEHYWGYTKLNSRKTSEYGVEHPRWEIFETKDYSIDVDFGEVYGQSFEFLNREAPVSVFLAEGSAIQVKVGNILQ